MWKEGRIMEENQKKQFQPDMNGIGSIMVIFFYLIILVALFGMTSFQESDIFMPALFGLVVSFCIVLYGIGFSTKLLRKMPIGFYVPICIFTILYALIQNVILFFGIHNMGAITYIFINLILLFLYFIIVLPTAMMGLKHRQKDVY